MVGTQSARSRHYGPRPQAPHREAEHMAAPTSSAEAPRNPCHRRAVHTGSTAPVRPPAQRSRFGSEADDRLWRRGTTDSGLVGGGERPLGPERSGFAGQFFQRRLKLSEPPLADLILPVGLKTLHGRDGDVQNPPATFGVSQG